MLFQVVVNLLLPIVGFNTSAAASRILVVDPVERVRKALGSAAWLSLGLAVLLFSATLAGGGVLESWLELPARWFPLAVVLAFGESLKSVHLTVWQMEKRPRAVAVFTVVQTAVRFGASLAPVLLLPNRLDGLLWGYSLSMLAFSLVSVGVLRSRRYLGLVWDQQGVRDVLHYGVPLIPHTTAAWLMGMADRVIIARLGNLGDVGIYSVGYSIGMITALVQDGFNRAWVPYFFEGLHRPTHEGMVRFARFIVAYGGALLLVAGAVTIGAPLLFPLLGKRFAAAQSFVVWIAFAYALNGMYKMFSNFLFFAKRTGTLSILTLSTGTVALLLTVLLVSRSGVIGAAYAAVLGQALLCGAIIIVSQRVYPMPWGAAMRWRTSGRGDRADQA